MTKTMSTLALLISASAIQAAPLEKCAENAVVTQIGNYSTGSDGLTPGDLTVWADGKSFEWRSRYGIDARVIDQSLSMAMYAKSTEKKVDIYCTSADQTYNARIIVVKDNS